MKNFIGKHLLLMCLTFFALKTYSIDSQSYCFYLTGSFLPNPPSFDMGGCSGNASLKVTCTSGNFPVDLQFDVSVTGDDCGGTLSQLMSSSTFGSINNNSATFPMGNCIPTDGVYTIQIGNIFCNSPIATQYNFKFEIVDANTGQVCSDELIGFTFNIIKLTSNTPSGAFYVCNNQSVQLTATNGPDAGNYSYDWYYNSGSQSGFNFSAMNPVTINTSGSYLLKINPINSGVYDNTACDNKTYNFSVIDGAMPHLTASDNTPATCPGEPSLLNVHGANTYTWTANGSPIITTFDTLTQHPLITTTYSVTGALYGGQCPLYPPLTVVITVNSFVLSISGPSNPVCPGTSTQLTASVAQLGSYSYSWTGPNGYTASGNVISVMPSIGNLTYTCSAKNLATNCIVKKTFTITMPTGVTPATINAPYGYQCDNGYIQYFNAVDPNNNQGYHWHTNPGSGAVVTPVNPFNGYQYVQVDCSHATGGDVTLYLDVVSNGCPSSTSITIYQCCAPPPILSHTHNYISISDPLVNNGNVSATNAYYANTPGKSTTYYVSGQLHLIGSSTIDGTTFIMNPGSSILVDGTLTINNSHIYACSDMWRGIEFVAYGGAAPVLNVTNSLIEDAAYGVNMAYSNFHEVYSTNEAFKPVANLTNAWFNRCALGVVADYDPLHPDSATNYATANNVYISGGLHFNGGVITTSNCVFSCLNGIAMNRVTSQNYNTIGLSPAKLHNYMYNPNFYTFCGIAANSTSLFDANGNQNVIQNCYFDNLVDGIITITDNITAYTPPSNLNVYNCSFQRAHLDPASENYNLIANFAYAQTDAINHTFAIGGAYYSPRIFLAASNNIQAIMQTQNSFLPFGSGINFLGSQLNVGGASTATGCTFSASDFGVVAFPDGSAEVDINYNNFVKANASYPYSTKNSGVYLTDQINRGYSTLYNVNSNTFKDHYKQGITAKLISNFGVNSLLNANNNSFTASANFTTANNFSTDFGMAPEAISLTGYAPSPLYSGNDQYVISNNNITNYELGITAYNAYGANINNNNINLFDDAANYTHGVSAINCTKAVISANIIKAGTSGPWQYGQYGIFTENNGGSIINCNTINGPDVSLKCQGPNNITAIEGNTFKNANVANFWMSYACIVGRQGAANYTYGNSFGCIQNDFFVDSGTDGTQSPFYYRNMGNQIPVGSGSDFPSSPSIAIPLSGYAVSKNIPYYACAFKKANPILNPVTAKKIAKDSLNVALYDSTAVFGNKHDLYRALIDTGAAYYNADAVLSSFMAGMVGSSHEKLVATDTLLNNAGNDTLKINQAIAINNSFVPAGKHDAYLQKANNLYAAFKKGKKHFTLSQLQSLQNIALLCPFEYGEAVYKARALMSLFDTVHYVNSCEQSSLNPPAAGNRLAFAGIEEVAAGEPNIKVYPNPAQNQLFIDGIKLQGGDNAELQVYNTLGQLVLKSKLNSGFTLIETGALNSGSYFYKVLQNDNVILTDKLVIIK